jgi:hypothetical protein
VCVCVIFNMVLAVIVIVANKKFTECRR